MNQAYMQSAAAMASGPPVGHLKSAVKLTFSARDLPSMDTFSPSDPMIVLSSWHRTNWVRVGRTEAIQNKANPDFVTQLKVDYFFEEEQRFRVDVYDVDSNNYDRLEEHDYIGYAEFTLGRLMSSPGSMLRLILSKKDGTRRSKATVIIHADELKESRDVANIHFAARGLYKHGFFSKDDTVLQIFRVRDDKTLFLVHTTPPVVRSQDPNYMPFTLPVGLMTSMLPDADLVIRICRKKGDKLESTGQVSVPFSQLIKQDPEPVGGANAQAHPPVGGAAPIPQGLPGTEKTFDLVKVDSKNREDPSTKRGTLIVHRFHVYRPLSFLDFVAGGLDMRLIIAIDFTASNQDPRSPNSLHFRNAQAGQMNPYERAIASVGSVLTSYTEKATFPVFGFGGVPRGSNTTQHCFPLAPLGHHVSQIPGVDGVLAQYRYALDNVTLSGPTYFAELVETAAAMAMEPYRPDHQHYTTLLIITDGMINDMAATVDAVVRASDKPMSIVIVGVGGADFTNMNTLDGDEQRLSSRSGFAQRDIVQFVPMREVEAEGPGAVASHTLAEIPDQIISFMNMHGVKPIPAREANPDQVYGEAPTFLLDKQASARI